MQEDTILRYIYKFRRLNADQIAKLLSAESWITTVRSFVSHMASEKTKEELLFRYHYPTLSSGFSPWMYELGKKGRKYLKKEHGYTLFPPQDDENVKYPTIMHDIYINDFLIAARKVPDVEIIDFWHDWELHHKPIKLQGSDLRDYVIPDSFINFRYVVGANTYTMPTWLELDRGTQTNTDYFKLKIRSILAGIYTNECEELFHLGRETDGSPIITVAFATTGSESRLKSIREWTQQELTRLGREIDGKLFLFTRLPHVVKNGKETDQLALDPAIFLSKSWYYPDDNQPISLLDLS